MSATVPSSSDQTRYCARHPSTETVLRCGRCDTPICPRCLISTPVGARCPTCAQIKRFATLLKPIEIVKAVSFGIGVAAVGTLIVGFIPFLGLLGLAAVGFGVGEAVSIGANRKRARELGPIAIVCLFIGYDLGRVISFVVEFQGRVPLGIELFIAPLLTLNGAVLLGLGLGALLAWMRVR